MQEFKLKKRRWTKKKDNLDIQNTQSLTGDLNNVTNETNETNTRALFSINEIEIEKDNLNLSLDKLNQTDSKNLSDFKTSLNSVFTRFRINNSNNNDSKKEYSFTNQLNDSIVFYKNYISKPQDTNCSQQRLFAWKPMLTPKFVINLFLICSILFIPIGVILIFNSNNIYEFRYDYTDCKDFNNLTQTCHSQLVKNISYNCLCRVYFYEDRFQDETLYVYYMLDNYYQNIRQYVRSVDSMQLLGRDAKQELASDCEPFKYKIDKSNNKIKYAPCGAIANSLFNDSFSIYYINKNTNESIKLNVSKSNIAWDWDRKYKYSNPSDFENTIKPPNWNKNITMLDLGYKNEDLMVWMRTAAFPSFRKLYGRILLEENLKLAHKLEKNTRLFYKLLKSFENSEFNSTNIEIKVTKNYDNTSDLKTIRLPKGQYYIDINYKYMVKQFNGKKIFILANVSWLGGKSYFMAWAYIIVGCLCFIGAFVLFFLHVYFGNMHYNTAILLVDTTTSLVK